MVLLWGAALPDGAQPVEIARRQLGENTRAVHLPPPPDAAQRPLGTPVYRTAAWAFSSAQEYASVLGDQVPGYSYSRIDNPTVDAFARAVAALEGANLPRWPAAQAFSSGMAAISGVLWTFARAGAHVVASAAVYGGTYSLLRNVMTRFGVETDFVDITDADAVAAAMRPATRIIYAEAIANPTTAVADIKRLAEIAHERGALLVIDSTLAPPVVCRPLEHGADLVLHSATKYIGGHSDVTGGVVTGPLELITQIRTTRIDTGGSLSPDDAFLLRRGLETLPVRVRRQCATASVFAATLAKHPAVAYVDYPGLPTHPGHATARRLFDSGPEGVRFGAIVTVTPYGGREAGLAFASALRLAAAATSLGGTHTVVSHVASTTHRQLDERALAAAGIDAGAVRFSIGLEDAEDLISDAFIALEGLAAETRGYPHADVTPRQPLSRRSAASIVGSNRALFSCRSFLKLDAAGHQGSSRQRELAGAAEVGMGSAGKIRVAVVFGGRSAEHAVSCASAGLVLSAIDRNRYDVVPVGIARDGRWVLTSGDPARLALSAGSQPSVDAVATPGVSVTPVAGPGGGALVFSGAAAVPAELGEVDVVLPLLHGSYGEDGTIQGLLEMAGIRYAGAGVLASAAGMDKEYSKLLFAARGLPIGPYVVVRDRDWAAPSSLERKRVLDDIAEVGWPVFVKPARGGSSIGTSRVDSPDGLEAAIEEARRHDSKVLVEAAIDGVEIECAVLEGVDGGPPEASVPGMIVVDPGSTWYDFEAKYLAAQSRMEIPAPIPAAAAEQVRSLACAAFEAIGCEGLARIDFFYSSAGNVLVNEINTMPGMTPSSGFPMMWAASGLPLPQLIDRIISAALAKR